MENKKEIFILTDDFKLCIDCGSEIAVFEGEDPKSPERCAYCDDIHEFRAKQKAKASR